MSWNDEARALAFIASSIDQLADLNEQFILQLRIRLVVDVHWKIWNSVVLYVLLVDLMYEVMSGRTEITSLDLNFNGLFHTLYVVMVGQFTTLLRNCSSRNGSLWGLISAETAIWARSCL